MSAKPAPAESMISNSATESIEASEAKAASARIRDFLDGNRYAVAGASTNPEKYGNRVLHAYQQAERDVIAINPRITAGDRIRGALTFPRLAEVPDLVTVHGLSMVTPPAVTESLIDEIMDLRDEIPGAIPRIWMQPGAESDRAIAAAQANGISVIAGGPCVLVALGYRGGS